MEKNYREEQKVGRPIRRPLLLVSLFCWSTLIVMDQWKPQPENDSALMLPLFFAGMLFTFLYVLTLTVRFVTVIQPNGCIHIRFLPFFKETIKMSEVVKMEIAAYEVTGFGVRYGIADRITYYKASGNTGLYLTLSDNTTIVIGTNKETELMSFLTHLNKTGSAAHRPSLAIVKSLKPGPAKRSGRST